MKTISAILVLATILIGIGVIIGGILAIIEDLTDDSGEPIDM